MPNSVVVERRSGGMGLAGFLTIIFVILKCTGHVEWSWYWVFSPIWIPLALVAVIWIVVGLLTLLAAVFK